MIDHPFYKSSKFDNKVLNEIFDYEKNNSDSYQTYLNEGHWYRQHRVKRSAILGTSRDLIPLRYIDERGDEIQNKFFVLWENEKTHTSDLINKFESVANSKMFEEFSEIVGPHFCTDMKEQLLEKKNMEKKLLASPPLPDKPSHGQAVTHVYSNNSISIQVYAPSIKSQNSINSFLETLKKGQEIFYNLLERTDCTTGAIKFISAGYGNNLNAIERFENLKRSKSVIKNNDFTIRSHISIKNISHEEGKNKINDDWKLNARVSIKHAFMKVFPQKYKGLFSTTCEASDQFGDTSFENVDCNLENIPRKIYSTKEKRDCDLKYNVLTLINAFLKCDKANTIANSYFEDIANSMKNTNTQQISNNNRIKFRAVGSFYMEGNIVTAETNVDVLTANVNTVSSTIGEAIAAEILSGAYACYPGYEALSYLVKAECTGPTSEIFTKLKSLEETLSSDGTLSSNNQKPQNSSGFESSGGINGSSDFSAESLCGFGTMYNGEHCVSNNPTDSSTALNKTKNSSKKDVIIVSTITGVITCVIVLILSIVILKK